MLARGLVDRKTTFLKLMQIVSYVTILAQILSQHK